MGKNTPPLDDNGKQDYIKLHLFNDLRWLLSAATEWSIQDQLKLGVDGYHVQLYAMDSAFLHARALFEFFTKETSDNHYGSEEFLGRGTVLKSDSYKNQWANPLHKFLMHAQDRSCPARLKTSGGEKDLNRMPVDFACEILRLWEEFEEELGKTSDPAARKLQKLAREKRKEAIENAQHVVNSPVAQRHASEKGQRLSPVFPLVD